MRVHPLVAPLFSTAESALADEQATDDEILSQGKAAVRLDSSSLILLDERLRARHRQERILRRRQATAGLIGIKED